MTEPEGEEAARAPAGCLLLPSLEETARAEEKDDEDAAAQAIAPAASRTLHASLKGSSHIPQRVAEAALPKAHAGQCHIMMVLFSLLPHTSRREKNPPAPRPAAIPRAGNNSRGDTASLWVWHLNLLRASGPHFLIL